MLRLTVESAPPRMMMRMPEKRRKPPRGPTKDGMRSSETSAPWRAPNGPQIASAARMAAHHGPCARGLLYHLRGVAPADERDRADRQVDLRDEQDHRLGDREDHVHG